MARRLVSVPTHYAITAQRKLQPLAKRVRPLARHGSVIVPPDHVSLGHAWLRLYTESGKWGVPLRFEGMSLQGQIAARLEPLLISGKVCSFGVEQGSLRRWWLPRDIWTIEATFCGRKCRQAEIAVGGHQVTVPAPVGGVLKCIAVVSLHDLAVAFGATDPPPRPSPNNVAGVKNIALWAGRLSRSRKLGRPSAWHDAYAPLLRERFLNGSVGPYFEDEVERAQAWFAEHPAVTAIQRPTIVKNLRAEYDEAVLPWRPKRK
jgi:hypothetical protein